MSATHEQLPPWPGAFVKRVASDYPSWLPRQSPLGKWRQPQKSVFRCLSTSAKATVPSCSPSTVGMDIAVVLRLLALIQGEAPGVLYLGGRLMSLLCLEQQLLHQVSKAKK